jgi:hypothetical protein
MGIKIFPQEKIIKNTKKRMKENHNKLIYIFFKKKLYDTQIGDKDKNTMKEKQNNKFVRILVHRQLLCSLPEPDVYECIHKAPSRQNRWK